MYILNFILRAVPTIVFEHTQSGHLKILGFPIGDAYKYRDIFARFKIMQRK